MRTHLFALILCFLSLKSASQVNLNSGLRAQYDFSGNALDVTGQGFDGVVNGAVLTDDRFGNPNAAYQFNGLDQNIEVTGFQNMINGNDIAISFWAKTANVKTQGMFVLFPDNINDRLFAGNYYSHNGISSLFWDYGDIYANGRLASIGTFFQPVWEHYVFISSTTNNIMQVYRNGYLFIQKSGSHIIMNKNRTFCIGGNMAGSSITNCFFAGTLDDIRIYDRVLNPAEVMALYHGYYESNVKDLRVFITNWPNPRPGFQEELYLICQNVGTTTVSGYVELNYDSHYQFISANQTPDSVNANASYIGFNFSNLPSGGQKVFTCLMSLPTSVTLGTPLSSTAVIYPVTGDTVPWDNYDTLNQIVVNGYDPNDILVNPEGDVQKSFVQTGQWLTYTIRFQNTGNASAINVRVENQLDSDFYISSLEIIGASHNFTWSLSNSNKLTFFFNNINLPDSGSNLMGSNGFVRYRIKGLPYLQVGDLITNNANIFFDFNLPVLTNTVTTTIVAPTGIYSHAANNNNEFLVLPNPFINQLNVVVPNVLSKELQIRIVDLHGKTVYHQQHSVSQNQIITLELPVLPDGVYLLTAASESAVFYRKIIRLE